MFFLPQCEEALLDLSDIVVNTAVSREITLHNDSNCSLHYELSVEQVLQGSYAEEAAETDDVGMFDRHLLIDLLIYSNLFIYQFIYIYINLFYLLIYISYLCNIWFMYLFTYLSLSFYLFVCLYFFLFIILYT